MADKIVIIQGSPTDTPYVDKIVSALQQYGIPVERRIASAHRTPEHLQRILNQYERDRVVFIPVAGLSDALSGTVAAKFSGRVVACPPDAEKYGDTKVFSSTATPRGITVLYAKNPQEAALLSTSVLKLYDHFRIGELRKEADERANQTILADARLQGVDAALPNTVFKRGKTRDVYDLGDGTLLVVGTDRVSAFDVNMAERIPGKGEALTELAEHWFKSTQDIIPNHFLERVDEESIRVKKAQRIDVEWIARGYIYGSLWRAYQKGERALYEMQFPDGLVEAQELDQPVFTPTTKSDIGHDKPITKKEAIASRLLTDQEWELLKGTTIELYNRYRAVAKERGIHLADMKIEFGRIGGDLVQIDEPPNHDSARLWSMKFYAPSGKQEGHALDKEFMRQYLLETGYSGNGPVPHLPELVVDQVSRRCRGATEVLTEKENDITKFGLMSVEQVLQELKK